MAILTVTDLAKAFGANQIFADVSFQTQPGEKVGLVGINGTGKSTLLRAIVAAAGEIGRGGDGTESETVSRVAAVRDEHLANAGSISLQRGASLGYLRQSPDFAPGLTVYGAAREANAGVFAMRERLEDLAATMSRPEVHDVPELLAEYMESYTALNEQFERMDGYQAESRIRGVLSGLGFTTAQFEQPLATMSGGERTRAELARLLLLRPDLLLLDEPTNHLDVSATEWLEDYLSTYTGGALIVSHDRFFLDRVVTRILEMSHGRVRSYPGNYTAFQNQREMERLSQTRAYERQQQVIAREEDFIRSAKATEKAKKTANSREKRLAMLERVERPESDLTAHISFEVLHRSGNRVLDVVGLTKRFGERAVIEDGSFTVFYRDRIGIVGPNGAGKTTLLRLLTGQEIPDSGSVNTGAGVITGYFDQLHQGLDDAKSPFDEIMGTRRMTNVDARNLLGRYLFSGDDVFRPIGELSGGERSRVALAKISLSKANLLVLDEPTNHLDLSLVESLEEALAEYPGTLIVVSHDRFFINKVCTRIFEVEGGRVTTYDGNYVSYQEAKRGASGKDESARRGSVSVPVSDQLVRGVLPESPAESEAPAASAAPRLSKREAMLRAQRLAALEEAVAQTESRIKELETAMANPSLYDDFEAVRRLQGEYDEARTQLEDLMQDWLKAAGE